MSQTKARAAPALANSNCSTINATDALTKTKAPTHRHTDAISPHRSVSRGRTGNCADTPLTPADASGPASAQRYAQGRRIRVRHVGRTVRPPRRLSEMLDPIVLRVESPILHPAPAKPGDVILIYPDRVDIVRPAPNNQGAWLSQWMQGHLTPASAEDATRLRALMLPDPEPPRPRIAQPVRGRRRLG